MATITKEGMDLIIRLPLHTPKSAKDGKRFWVAGTKGPLTSNVRFDGRLVTVIASAYIEPHELEEKTLAKGRMAELSGRLR